MLLQVRHDVFGDGVTFSFRYSLLETPNDLAGPAQREGNLVLEHVPAGHLQENVEGRGVRPGGLVERLAAIARTTRLHLGSAIRAAVSGPTNLRHGHF